VLVLVLVVELVEVLVVEVVTVDDEVEVLELVLELELVDVPVVLVCVCAMQNLIRGKARVTHDAVRAMRRMVRNIWQCAWCVCVCCWDVLAGIGSGS
jgi:hypothetical protein